MPIYTIKLPPVFNKGKMLFDAIELSEAQAVVLIEQGIISQKEKDLSSVDDEQKEVIPDIEPSLPSETTTSVEQVETSATEEPNADAELLEFFNNASVEDLGNLKNIGRTRAEKIRNNAPYTSLSDIQAQSGLSNQGWADAISDLIV